MGRKRVLCVVVAWCLAVALGPVCLADEETRDGDGASKKKWHFGLYLEAAFGSMTMDTLDASIVTSAIDTSSGIFDFGDSDFARAAVGWQLNPAKLGRFVFKYESYREGGGYNYTGQGLQSRAEGTSDLVSSPVVWWTVSADRNGFNSERTIPTWTIADDTNGDDIPDADEVRYLEDPADRLRIEGPAPDNMANRLTTYDVFYERRFGGRKTRAEWAVGLRYFEYTGNISAGAWLNTDVSGSGYTDGGILRLLSFSQDASGGGPVFAIGLEQVFLRERLAIYGDVHAAFVMSTVTTDSGPFYTLVRDTNTGVFVTSPAQIDRSTDKTTWQPGIEIGLRGQPVAGLFLYVAYILNSYQDTVITPTEIIIPENPNQAPFGVDGIYSTQDLIYDGAIFGLSFQY
jgi:hypothetical protein